MAELLTKDFALEEIESVIACLRDSAPGKDQIVAEDVRCLRPRRVLEVFNMILRNEITPAAWVESVLVSIPKKGSDPQTLQATEEAFYVVRVTQTVLVV